MGLGCRKSTSNKYGVFKVVSGGYIKDSNEVIETLILECVSCGRRRKFTVTEEYVTLDNPFREKLNKLYWKQEMSIREISNYLNITSRKVYYWMKKYNIQRRR